MTVYNEEGLKAARRFSRWHLGDAEWAQDILDAYFNPEAANRNLDEEMDQ